VVLTVFSIVLWPSTTPRQQYDAWSGALFLWTLSGIVFVVYLIVAELILGALCPACTLVHVICVVVCVLAYRMLAPEWRLLHSVPSVLVTLRWWVALALVLNVAPIVYYNLPQPSLESFARCLQTQQVRMYGTDTCQMCNVQKKLFGESWSFVDYVDCQQQPALCSAGAIVAYPTWARLKNGAIVVRHEGVMTTKELAEWSGCRR
jgi:hypothetical protein